MCHNYMTKNVKYIEPKYAFLETKSKIKTIYNNKNFHVYQLTISQLPRYSFGDVKKQNVDILEFVLRGKSYIFVTSAIQFIRNIKYV